MSSPTKKGTRVSLSWNGAKGVACLRCGVTIADEDKGTILVALDPDGADIRQFVIYCLTSQLTVLT